MIERRALVRLLQAHVAADAREEADRCAMLRLAQELRRPLSRDERAAHFTASAFVIDETGARTCLVEHVKLGRRLQPGGHIEHTDTSLESAAIREARGDGARSGLASERAAAVRRRHPRDPGASGRAGALPPRRALLADRPRRAVRREPRGMPSARPATAPSTGSPPRPRRSPRSRRPGRTRGRPRGKPRAPAPGARARGPPTSGRERARCPPARRGSRSRSRRRRRSSSRSEKRIATAVSPRTIGMIARVARDGIEACVGEHGAELPCVGPQSRDQRGVLPQRVDRRERAARDGGGQRVGEELRPRALRQELADLGARRDVASRGAAECLAERAGHDVDRPAQAEVLGGPERRARRARRRRASRRGPRSRRARRRASTSSGSRARSPSIEKTPSVTTSLRWPGSQAASSPRQGLQIGMGVHRLAGRLREPDRVDDRRVVERVREDHRARVGERGDERFVRVPAGDVGQGGLAARRGPPAPAPARRAARTCRR